MQTGDQVVFSNLNKKSILQVEIFKNSSQNQTVRVETYWRSGLFKITFMHDYEIEAFEEILNVLYEYGDEKHAKLISNAIIDHREKQKILTTFDLANIIEDCYPGKRKKIHPATKSFQAFRIFINNELNEITESLNQAKKLLKKNGIIVVISFHSLEDNLVKSYFKSHKVEYPKDIPINSIENQEFKCIAKKIRASKDEVSINPRSRSAIMRVFKKL